MTIIGVNILLSSAYAPHWPRIEEDLSAVPALIHKTCRCPDSCPRCADICVEPERYEIKRREMLAMHFSGLSQLPLDGDELHDILLELGSQVREHIGGSPDTLMVDMDHGGIARAFANRGESFT
jgi:hypothetical protein